MTDKEKGSCSVNICRGTEPERLHPAVLIWLCLLPVTADVTEEAVGQGQWHKAVWSQKQSDEE